MEIPKHIIKMIGKDYEVERRRVFKEDINRIELEILQ